MKTTLIILSVFLFLNTSCNKKSAETIQESTETSQSAVPSQRKFILSEVESKMNMPDCLQEYADLDQVINEQGTIVVVMDMAMISYKSSSRLHACNIPDGFKEGDEVLFSGVIKEAPKGVRLAGTPFKLSSIVKR